MIVEDTSNSNAPSKMMKQKRMYRSDQPAGSGSVSSALERRLRGLRRVGAGGDTSQLLREQQQATTTTSNDRPNLFAFVSTKRRRAAGQTGASLSAATQGGQHTCSRCDQLILDKYILSACGKFWHESCLKCDRCNGRLVDLGPTLYERHDMKFCRRDYNELFGQEQQAQRSNVCSVCNKPISASEMIMRARTNIYHLECFACQLCGLRFCVGERFYLCENKIVCQFDYDEHAMIALGREPYYAPQLEQQQQQPQQADLQGLSGPLVEMCSGSAAGDAIGPRAIGAEPAAAEATDATATYGPGGAAAGSPESEAQSGAGEEICELGRAEDELPEQNQGDLQAAPGVEIGSCESQKAERGTFEEGNNLVNEGESQASPRQSGQNGREELTRPESAGEKGEANKGD